ncbi:putative disease resistance protein RGA1 [Forsythia ovata]|uniref:Disease resistance protein RGA1 n=1 Tax=Forsythia ovata TaxID=205694 RepID=A0ABD1TPA5_9LAMI
MGMGGVGKTTLAQLVYNDDRLNGIAVSISAQKVNVKIEDVTKVAKIMSFIPAHPLNVLSDNDALSLLAQHSLGTKIFDIRPDLREIGKSTVIRCKNLPLAVKSLRELLHTKASPKEWNDVLNSKIWIAENTSEIHPVLKLMA